MAPRYRPQQNSTNPNDCWQIQGLTEAQVSAAVLQSMGYPLRHVAEKIGVSAWTLTSWQKLPAYRSLVSTYLSDINAATINQVVGARMMAIKRLMAIVSNPESDDRTAVSAAGIILSQPVNTPPARQPQELAEIDEYDRAKRTEALRDMSELMSALSRN